MAPPLRLAISIENPDLTKRLKLLLGGVAGLELVSAGQAADATLIGPPASAPISAVGDVALTPRELEVLTLLAEGASNKVVARALGISVYTAKFHVGSLIEKLDAIGRTDAVAHAARLGLITL